METLKVKDLFTKAFDDKYGDLDIYDDVCESLAVAFCGCLRLTDKGAEKFKDVLEDDVDIYADNSDGPHMVVIIDGFPEGVWQHHLRLLKKLFNGAAGYCTEEEYGEWFWEVMNENY